MSIITVRERAILASTIIAVWAGEQADDTPQDDDEQTPKPKGARSVRSIKNIMAGGDEALREVKKAYMGFRTQHYELTLPWTADARAERQRGPRLLPVALLSRYMSAMSARRTAAIASRDYMLARYQEDVCRAVSHINLTGRHQVGSPMTGEEYPTLNELSAKFRINFGFEPVADGASFPDNKLREPLTKALEARQAIMVKSAMDDVFDRTRQCLAHLHERITSGTGAFKVTTVVSVAELPNLLAGWNLTDDAVLNDVSDRVSRLPHMNADTLRSSAPARAELARYIEGCLEVMENGNG